MKKYIRLPLNQRLSLISMGVFLPMLLLVVYLLFSLQNAADAYSDITTSVTYANRYNKAFKARMDYSAYLAVISGRSMDTMGNGEITVNGIETVNPYEYIPEMEAVCDQLSGMATVTAL